MKGSTAMDLSKSTLGIELGSTRIKAVLIDENHIPVLLNFFNEKIIN